MITVPSQHMLKRALDFQGNSSILPNDHRFGKTKGNPLLHVIEHQQCIYCTLGNIHVTAHFTIRAVLWHKSHFTDKDVGLQRCCSKSHRFFTCEHCFSRILQNKSKDSLNNLRQITQQENVTILLNQRE